MSETTTVNDNTVEISPSGMRNHRETAARRLAADLPRNDDRVREISTAVAHDATVWLDTPENDRGSGLGFRPPRGYEIEKVFVGANGGVAVKIREVDE
jgi:hypothetical protein